MHRKPRIVIEPTRAKKRPFQFAVKWQGCHWKNSQWWTFDEALVAAGVKSADSLPRRRSPRKKSS
jgi:hypothetical protein